MEINLQFFFILTSTFNDAGEMLYFGLHHNSSSTINIRITFLITTCQFWNVTSSKWDGTGCQPMNASSLSHVTCSCNHLTSFGGGLEVAPNKIDFTVLKVCI